MSCLVNSSSLAASWPPNTLAYYIKPGLPVLPADHVYQGPRWPSNINAYLLKPNRLVSPSYLLLPGGQMASNGHAYLLKSSLLVPPGDLLIFGGEATSQQPRLCLGGLQLLSQLPQLTLLDKNRIE